MKYEQLFSIVIYRAVWEEEEE